MPKSSSPRDSHPDDLDTVLVVSSDEIKKAREQVESLTSETATVDCHPVILDDTEEDTDRFSGSDASSSGLVKNPLKVNAKAAREAEPEIDTSTNVSVPRVMPMLDPDEEEIEISASGIISEVEVPAGKSEPRATITEVREVEPILTPQKKSEEKEKQKDKAKEKEAPKDAADALPRLHSPSIDDETATQERPKATKLPRFDDETKPMPKPNLVDIGAVLETVPLSSHLVQNVLAQVDARAAARASGQPVPQFQVPGGPVLHPPMPPQHATPRQHHAPAEIPPLHGAPMQPPSRKLGMEILITVAAFLFVALPALYYLYVSFTR